MEKQPVSSSNIAAIGYDQKTQTLEIDFNNGSTYQYYGVTNNVHDGFLSAGSHGKYFHAYIKGRYPESKIR